MASIQQVKDGVMRVLREAGHDVKEVDVRSIGREITFTVTMNRPQEAPLTEEEYTLKLRSVVHEWAEMVDEWCRDGLIARTELVQGGIAVSRRLVAMDPKILALIEVLEKTRCYCDAVAASGANCDRCVKIDSLTKQLTNPPRVRV